MSIRKFIDIASIIGIIASPIALGVVYSQTSARPVVAETIQVTTNKNFPLNKPQVINFEQNENFKKLTNRQQDDQLRDWLLLTALSGKGLSSQQLSQGAYDLPLVRYDFMNPVANFEYGATRSRSIDKDRIIALVHKASTPEQRKDDIAHIADRHRKDQGEKPKVIEVFEYDISTDKLSGSITRRQDIDASQVFTGEYGYFETSINSQSDLQSFLKQTDDITFSEVKGADLILGGRKIYSYKHQGIRLEDVAALWQSEKKIETRWENFKQEQEEKLKNLPVSEQEKEFKKAIAQEKKNGLVGGSGFSLDWQYDYQAIKTLLNEAKPQLLSLQINNKPLVSTGEIEAVTQSLSSRKTDAYLQLIEKLKNYYTQAGNNQSIAQAQQLKLQYNQQAQAIEAQITQKQNEIQEIITSQQLLGASTPESQVKVNQKQQELAQLNKELPALYSQYLKKHNLVTDNSEKIRKLLQSSEKQAFQTARYDGDLKGTEVGMVLFYTDLLMKMWNFNFDNSTVQAGIKNFNPETRIRLSSIYQKELEDLPYARLWFGTNDKGFQLNNNSIILARNSTKVYAASSNPSKSGAEEKADASVSAFLDWWNNHYEEVARYEPQYQRLNQIMKWSLVVNWLNESYQGSKLSFLQEVRVRRDNWFPDWARKQSNLKFQAWDKIKFFPPNYKGTTTEAMPLLTSEYFERFGKKGQRFVGGVSLASKNTFKGRASLPLTEEFSLPGRRSNIDYKSIIVENGKLQFSTLEGTKFQVKPISKTISEAIIIPKADTKLRSLNAEVANQAFTSKFVQTAGKTEYSAAIGDTDFGNLNVERTANGFKVGFDSREADVAYSLASDLSTSKQSGINVLANASEVKSFKYSASQPDVYYIQASNSNKWVKVSGGGGGKKPPSKSIMSVGEPEEGARIFKVESLSESEVLKQTQGFQQAAGKGRGSGNSGPFDPRKNAQRLAEDPIAYIAFEKKSLQQHISKIDAALKDGNYTEATKLINESPLYASNPSIKMRQALVDIQLNKMKVKQVTTEGVKTVGSNFYDEINNRSFRTIETDKEIYYVQDSPDIGNLDIKPTVAQSVSSNSGVKFYKLEADGNGSGNGGGNNGRYGNVGDSGNPSNEFRGSNINYSFNARFSNNPQAFINDEKCQKEDEKETEDCQREKTPLIVTK
jgi:hypothetical protein